jgi:hypothetical protein
VREGAGRDIAAEEDVVGLDPVEFGKNCLQRRKVAVNVVKSGD